MLLKAGSQNAPSFVMTWLVVKQGGQSQRVHHFYSNTGVTPGEQHASQGFDISPHWPTGVSEQQFASESLQEVSATAPSTAPLKAMGNNCQWEKESLPVPWQRLHSSHLKESHWRGAITLHMPWWTCMDYLIITVITVITVRIISFALEAAAVMQKHCFCLWRLQLLPLPARRIHLYYMAYSETIHTIIGCQDYNTT